MVYLNFLLADEQESGSVQIKTDLDPCSVFCSLFSCLCSRFCLLCFLSLVSALSFPFFVSGLFSLYRVLCTLFSFSLRVLCTRTYYVLFLSLYFVLVRTMFSFSLYTLYSVLLLCLLFSVHVHLTLLLVLSFLLSSVFFSLSCLGNAATVLGSIPASRH
jgi:hypothetical protein